MAEVSEYQYRQNFSPLLIVQTDSGGHVASYPLGTGDSFPRIKWPGHEAGHSPPSSAKVKNDGAIPPFPILPHGLMLS
jgi:hypothetical protein